MSLRTRLFLILVASTTLIWICGFSWIGINSQSEIDYLLDRRLMEAARMVASLNLKTGDIDLNSSSSDDSGQHPGNTKYERRLSCQIWSFDGHLIGRSANAPTSELTEQVGDFSERKVDGVLFRVYALEDATRGIRILVGDEVEQRRQAVRDLLSGLMIPAMIVLPAIGFLIWISIRRGLAPLRLAAETLTARGAENLAPLEIGPSPPEIQPLLNALNGLFEKVLAAREHERSFVAYAAHELRTPLAGLKTQAQVAIASSDPKIRDDALKHLIDAVDRAGRLVKQLLTISQLDANTEKRPDKWFNVGDLLGDIRRDVSLDLHPERIELSASLWDSRIEIDRELFHLAARNLVENALQLTPAEGKVRMFVQCGDNESKICVEDEGPGIPPEEHKLVLQRFVRGRHKYPTGSGLGLSIVTGALEQADAKLRLSRPENGRGLRAEIIMKAGRIRRKEAV